MNEDWRCAWVDHELRIIHICIVSLTFRKYEWYKQLQNLGKSNLKNEKQKKTDTIPIHQSILKGSLTFGVAGLCISSGLSGSLGPFINNVRMTRRLGLGPTTGISALRFVAGNNFIGGKALVGLNVADL
jgi:hypothetical protein